VAERSLSVVVLKVIIFLRRRLLFGVPATALLEGGRVDRGRVVVVMGGC
jgi:hypothetical protein